MNKKMVFMLLLIGVGFVGLSYAADNEDSQHRLGANGHGLAPVRRGGGGYNGGGIRKQPTAKLGRNGHGMQKKLGQKGQALTPLRLSRPTQPKGARHSKKAPVDAAARAQANATLDAFLDAFKKQDLPAAAEIFKSFDTPAEVATIVSNASKANMVALISTLIEMVAPFVTLANAAIAQQKVIATQGQEPKDEVPQLKDELPLVMQEQTN